MKFNNKYVIYTLIIIVCFCIKDGNTIRSIDQSILIHFQYMNKNGLINIYENAVFVLPYLIIAVFNIIEITSYVENKIFLISRFGSERKFNSFVLKKIMYIAMKNCIYYFIVLISITFLKNQYQFDVKNIICCFINVLLIELFFSILFYYLLEHFSVQNSYLIIIIFILFIPVIGFWGMYLKRNILFDFNFMTINTTFSVNEKISYNYSIILIHILIVLMVKIIKLEDF